MFVPSSVTMNLEPALPDSRLEAIFYRLVEKAQRSGRNVPESIVFATYHQPESDRARPQIVFVVQSLHPKQRFTGQVLRTLGSVPLDEWKNAEDMKWRFAGMPDPANNIFARLMREHLDTRKQLEELDD